jgi:hypothetical protein
MLTNAVSTFSTSVQLLQSTTVVVDACALHPPGYLGSILPTGFLHDPKPEACT